MDTQVRGGWRRASVEVLVVFLGILLALFADAQWADRQARVREAGYLASLSEDFIETEERLTTAISIADTVIAAASELLRLGPATAVGTDSLTLLLSRLRELPTLEPVTKTYDNVQGAGDILTIRDPELRAELADFHSRLILMNVVQETQERQFVGFFQPYVLQNLDYASLLGFWLPKYGNIEAPASVPDHAETIRSVMGSREFRNWVAVRLDWADDLQRQHLGVLSRVRAIREILEATR